ncbi:MAG TPA: LPS assembly protein LptD, partial [Magnetovibrio sp.]
AYNTLDVNLASLTRDQGADSKRISVKPAWNLSHVAPMGDIYKLTASLGIDFFHAQNLAATPAQGGIYNGAALRVNPEVSLDWRWPLARRTGSVTEIIEPIGQVVVSPYGGNSYKMANEDSRDFDFNDTNLFSNNRFTGYDRIETGPRTNYGVKWGVYGDQGGSTSVLVGQSYRLKKDDTFQTGSGLESNFSDYVARLQMSPGPHLNLLYRTRLDKDTLDFKRNEAGVFGTAGWFSYNADYVFFDRLKGSEFPGRRELSYGMGAKVTDTWSANMAGVRDLSGTGGQRSMNVGAVYEDECFRFDTTLSRTFYLDREIKPTDAIMFRLVFKTLGEVASDVVAN